MAIYTKTRACDGVVCYYVRYQAPDGKRRSELAGTKRQQAKDLLTDRLGQIKAGTWMDPRVPVAPPDRGPTFATFAKTFLADHPGRRRSDHYPDAVKVLVDELGPLELRTITRADLDRLRVKLENTVSPKTKRKRSPTTTLKLLRVLSRMFKMARRWGVLDVNPADDLEKPSPSGGKTRYLTPDEYEKLEAGAPPWLRPMLRLAVSTGLRLGEVAALEWKDVDIAAGELHVSEATKTGARTVPLSEPARRVLKASVRHVRSQFVFWQATEDGPESYASNEGRDLLSRSTRAAAVSAVLPGVGFHVLRHTAASWMVQAGVPLYEVQAMLGHSTPAMTQRYAHLAPDHLRKATAAIDRAMGETATATQAATQPETTSAGFSASAS